MAKLIPFPQGRNIGRARHVAKLWLAKNSRDREAYWSTTVNRMAAAMARVGFDDTEITNQVDAFQRAVQSGIDFSTQSDNRTPPGAA